MLVTVIVPVFDEAPTVDAAVEAILAAPLPEGVERRVLCIDDGSRDGSGEILQRLMNRHDNVDLVRHTENRGKGAAIATGLAHASGDIVMIHDADLEYDPADHVAVLEPILDGRADVVIGSRFLGQTHRVLYYWHFVANRFITLCSNLVTNLNLTDIECCTKAFRREVATHLTLREHRFGIEPEMVARFAKMRLEGRRLRIYEVPVSYSGRTYQEGKKIGWRDGVRALWVIGKGLGR